MKYDFELNKSLPEGPLRGFSKVLYYSSLVESIVSIIMDEGVDEIEVDASLKPILSFSNRFKFNIIKGPIMGPYLAGFLVVRQHLIRVICSPKFNNEIKIGTKLGVLR